MTRVAWGVLGTAKISSQHVLPAMLASPLIELRAIASRSLAAAQHLGGAFGIARAYGSYEELFAAPDIEAVYNPLPNHLHVAQTLRQAAGRVPIEEAFMVRHHPQWQRAHEIVRSSRIGTLRAVQVFFSYFNDATSALLDFGGGRQLGLTVSTQSCRYQRVQAVGTSGRIELQFPFNAPRGGAMRIAVDDGGALDGSGISIETLSEADQYRLRAEAFSRRVRGEQARGSASTTPSRRCASSMRSGARRPASAGKMWPDVAEFGLSVA